MEVQDRYLKYRGRVLADQLYRARIRYLHLLREAERAGRLELIEDSDRAFLDRRK